MLKHLCDATAVIMKKALVKFKSLSYNGTRWKVNEIFHSDPKW